MNFNLLICILDLVFIKQTISAQYQSQKNVGSQNAVSYALPGVFNNLPGGNNPPTANSFGTLNTQLSESDLPANRPRQQTEALFINVFDDRLINNALLHNNLPVFPVKNFLANNLPTVSHLPANNVVTNIKPPVSGFSANNIPANNFLTVLPTANNLPVANSLPNIKNLLTPNPQSVNPITHQPVTNIINNDLLVNPNGLTNNGILTTAPIFGSRMPNVNTIDKTQNFNNMVNMAPNFKNLPTNELIANNILPVANNNQFGSYNENKALLAAQPALPINSEVPRNTFVLNNNLPFTNNFPFGNELIFNPQINNHLNNIPEPIPVCEELPVPNVLNNAIFTIPNNVNGISSVTNSIPNHIQPHNNGLLNIITPENHFPNRVLNIEQSFLAPLPMNVPNFFNDQVQNWQSNAKQSFLALPLTHILGNDLPNNLLTYKTLGDNLPGVNLQNVPSHILPDLPINNIISEYLPFVNSINVPATSLSPSNNLFSLGHLTNLPMFNGLPVIGVTETVTVINTAPSLYL